MLIQCQLGLMVVILLGIGMFYLQQRLTFQSGKREKGRSRHLHKTVTGTLVSIMLSSIIQQSLALKQLTAAVQFAVGCVLLIVCTFRLKQTDELTPTKATDKQMMHGNLSLVVVRCGRRCENKGALITRFQDGLNCSLIYVDFLW